MLDIAGMEPQTREGREASKKAAKEAAAIAATAFSPHNSSRRMASAINDSLVDESMGDEYDEDDEYDSLDDVPIPMNYLDNNDKSQISKDTITEVNHFRSGDTSLVQVGHSENTTEEHEYVSTDVTDNKSSVVKPKSSGKTKNKHAKNKSGKVKSKVKNINANLSMVKTSESLQTGEEFTSINDSVL